MESPIGKYIAHKPSIKPVIVVPGRKSENAKFPSLSLKISSLSVKVCTQSLEKAVGAVIGRCEPWKELRAHVCVGLLVNLEGMPFNPRVHKACHACGVISDRVEQHDVFIPRLSNTLC